MEQLNKAERELAIKHVVQMQHREQMRGKRNGR